MGRKLLHCASGQDCGHLLEESEENHDKLEGYSIFVSRFERCTFQDIHQECWPHGLVFQAGLVFDVHLCSSCSKDARSCACM